jgi:hypothetical protein
MILLLLLNRWYVKRHPETYCPSGHRWRTDTPRQFKGVDVPTGWWYCGASIGCWSVRYPDGTVRRTGSKRAFSEVVAEHISVPPPPPMPEVWAS